MVDREKEMLICDYCNKEVKRYARQKEKLCKKCYNNLFKPKEICHICNELKIVGCRKGGKPSCKNCYEKFLRKKEKCFGCEQNKKVWIRKEKNPFCRSCYEKMFRKSEICSNCGEDKLVQYRHEGQPICQNCYKLFQPKEMCSNCKKIKIIWMRQETGPICQGCYTRFRLDTDENFRIIFMVNKRIRRCVRENIIPKKPSDVDYEKIIEHLGPCPGDLKDYHIDHKIPLSSFNLSDSEQFQKAFAPENHQWLLAKDNLKKGAKISSIFGNNKQNG